MHVFRSGTVLLILSAMSSLADAQTTPPVTDQSVSILSDLMTGDIDNTLLSAVGNVDISIGDFDLEADQATYLTDGKIISAVGHVRLRGLGSVTIQADRIQTTTSLEQIYASNVSLSFGQGILKARRAITTSDGEIILERVAATGCPECSSNKWPFWSVSAISARRDPQTKRVIFTHSILRINGIPVFYVPGISFPSPEVPRASGFLLPRFSNSQVGLTAELPYHLVLSPNQDVTVSAKLTGLSPLSKIAYRGYFDTVRIAFDGGLTFDPSPDPTPDGAQGQNWRGHIRGSAAFDLGPNWRVGAIVERQSDPVYDLRYDIERVQKAGDRLYWGEPRSLLGQVYLTRSGITHDVEAGAFSFQDIRASPITPTEPPVIPYVRAQGRLDLGRLGSARIDGLAFAGQPAMADRPDTYATARLSWTRPTRVGLGMVLTPHLLARIDRSSQDRTDAVAGSARLGASLSWPLALAGQWGSALIEPRAWISGDINSGPRPSAPLWARTLGATSIETPDHAGILGDSPVGWVGVDSKASFGSALLGLSAGRRWFADSGQDSVFAVRLSQANNFATARVILDDALSIRDTDTGIAFTYGDLSARLTWFISTTRDRQGGRIELGYRLDDEWSLSYIRESNVSDSFDIIEVAEVVYDGECTVFKLSLRRSGITFDSITPNTTLGFSLDFKIPS